MSRAVTFRQADVDRALAVAAKRGLPIRGYEITTDGTIRVLTGTAAQEQPLTALERWERENGDRAA